MENASRHFVLIHGAGHGAWCWYKVVALLKASGHRVTTLDMGACGINTKRLSEITSFLDYIQPLKEFMASLPLDEKVVLVGHSFGGFGISIAMEMFPEKVAVSVYVTAFMPNFTAPPATLTEEFLKRGPTGNGSMSNVELLFEDGPDNPPTSAVFSPNQLASMYRKSPPEDLELGKMMVRPCGIYITDLLKEDILTEEKFGKGRRVFVVCEEDETLPEEFQRWMISKSPPNQVMSIEASDHMPMFSNPTELCFSLQEIAQLYH